MVFYASRIIAKLVFRGLSPSHVKKEIQRSTDRNAAGIEGILERDAIGSQSAVTSDKRLIGIHFQKRQTKWVCI